MTKEFKSLSDKMIKADYVYDNLSTTGEVGRNIDIKEFIKILKEKLSKLHKHDTINRTVINSIIDELAGPKLITK